MRDILLGPGETITIERRLDAGEDSHGNPVKAFSAPEKAQVYGIAPKVATEETEIAQDYTNQSSWDIYAPLGFLISAYDLVTLPSGKKCEVIGEPKIWSALPILDILSVGGIQFVVVEKK